MIKIIGVRFRQAGKVYYFDPGEAELSVGQQVIVETARGTEMGTVIVPNKEVADEEVVQPLKPLVRVASDEDIAMAGSFRAKEAEARRLCQEKIDKHELDMKLVDAEYTFDGNKILFYFTSDGRVDFRELVKDLASVFRTRIELRQIGVRDETKIRGGIGICGRCLCCNSYLADFVPVSIKMAKEQSLSLNPTKISGVCGRLMCCLKNEEDTYEYLNSCLPSVGEPVLHASDNVKGTVQSVNVLRQLVKVVVSLEGDDLEVREYPLSELQFAGKKAHCDGCPNTSEAVPEEGDNAGLEQLEDMPAAENTARQDRTRPRSRDKNMGNRENGGRSRENGGRRREDGGRSREDGGRSRGNGRRPEDRRRPEDGSRPGTGEKRRREDRGRSEDRSRTEDRNRADSAKEERPVKEGTPNHSENKDRNRDASGSREGRRNRSRNRGRGRDNGEASAAESGSQPAGGRSSQSAEGGSSQPAAGGSQTE